MKVKKMLCMLMMLLGLCGTAMAQKSIDKVVEEMERDKDARITSIKKRDPQTRKVVKVTKTIRVNNDMFAKRALAAFEREEENALTSIKEKRSRVEYTLTFQSKEDKRTYILNIRNNKDVEVSVFITPLNDRADSHQVKKGGKIYSIDAEHNPVEVTAYALDAAKKELKEYKATYQKLVNVKVETVPEKKEYKAIVYKNGERIQ